MHSLISAPGATPSARIEVNPVGCASTRTAQRSTYAASLSNSRRTNLKLRVRVGRVLGGPGESGSPPKTLVDALRCHPPGPSLQLTDRLGGIAHFARHQLLCVEGVKRPRVDGNDSASNMPRGLVFSPDSSFSVDCAVRCAKHRVLCSPHAHIKTKPHAALIAKHFVCRPR